MTVSVVRLDVISMEEATPTPSGAPMVGYVCPRTRLSSGFLQGTLLNKVLCEICKMLAFMMGTHFPSFTPKCSTVFHVPFTHVVCVRSRTTRRVQEPPQRFRCKEHMQNQNQRTNVPTVRK
ncbi:hypothetical protein GOP47_0022820 [Adiantum capillus-veneris]|uniref:Uncharacterized protein n=1 Tax=Adiantum capillus-veneris TaxID=13818 RepID=A0A9D4U8F6_ADICA|nr:hypothetical protein GOP47_0022820 [Adiantum capillus-veneris]